VILVGAWTSTFAIISMPFMTISDDAANPADFEWTNARFVRILVRKTHLLRHLIPKMHHLTKTCSGQT
jgi:hypothetical protein